jgi:hypothetical protein
MPPGLPDLPRRLGTAGRRAVVPHDTSTEESRYRLSLKITLRR